MWRNFINVTFHNFNEKDKNKTNLLRSMNDNLLVISHLHEMNVEHETIVQYNNVWKLNWSQIVVRYIKQWMSFSLVRFYVRLISFDKVYAFWNPCE